MLLHGPPWWEYHEIRRRCASLAGGAGQHGEDRRILRTENIATVLASIDPPLAEEVREGIM